MPSSRFVRAVAGDELTGPVDGLFGTPVTSPVNGFVGAPVNGFVGALFSGLGQTGFFRLRF